MSIKCPQCGAEYDVTLFTLDRSIRCDCGTSVDLVVGHQQTSKDGMQVVSPEGSREGVSLNKEPEGNDVTTLGDAVHVEALDTRMPPDTPTTAPVRQSRRFLWLVIVHIVIGGVGAYLTSFLDIIYSALRVAAFVGLIFSQVSLLGIWGSLGTNHWRTRVIGVVVGNGYLFIVFNIGVNDVSIETLIVFLAVIMVVSLPLLIARICRVVIRLDASPVTAVGPIQFSIRHLIVVTFVVACLITICKLVQPILSRRPNIDLLAIALTFGIVGVIPLWSALASKWPTVFSVGVVAVGACTGYCLGWVYMEEELYWMTHTATEALSVVVSLLLVRSWGYQLVRLPRSDRKWISTPTETTVER